MTDQQAARLTNFFDAGYTIQIDFGPYLNGNVKSMGKTDYDDEASPYVYSDEVYSDQPLSSIHLNDVQIFKPVSFKDEEIEEQDTIDNGYYGS